MREIIIYLSTAFAVLLIVVSFLTWGDNGKEQLQTNLKANVVEASNIDNHSVAAPLNRKNIQKTVHAVSPE